MECTRNKEKEKIIAMESHTQQSHIQDTESEIHLAPIQIVDYKMETTTQIHKEHYKLGYVPS